MKKKNEILYVIAWVGEKFGLKGERISIGNSFHRDGGWAAENFPQHFPGMIITPDDAEMIRNAGMERYINRRDA